MIPVINKYVIKHLDMLVKLPEAQRNNIDIMDEFQVISGAMVMKLFLGEQELSEHDDEVLTKRLAHITALSAMQVADPLTAIFGPKVIDYGLTQTHRDIMDGRAFYRNLGEEVLKKKKAKLQSGKRPDKADGNQFKGMIELILTRTKHSMDHSIRTTSRTKKSSMNSSSSSSQEWIRQVTRSHSASTI
jgi:hypothetical protein